MLAKIFIFIVIFLNIYNLSLGDAYKANIRVLTHGNEKALVIFDIKNNYKLYYQYPNTTEIAIKASQHKRNLELIYSTPRYFKDNNLEITSYIKNAYLKINSSISSNFPIKFDYVLCNHNCFRETQIISLTYVDAIEYDNYYNQLSPEFIQNNINEPQSHFNWLYILLLAFIGGLILNLMPCILPIITLKIYSFINNPKRGDLIWQILGILSSMIFIASIQIAAKKVGESFILGSQFYNSYFLVVTTIMVTLGVLVSTHRLNIKIPNYVSNIITHKSLNYLTSFASGFFITLIATPCSAPILGLALGASLYSNDLQTIMIFLMIGLGLSVPYILLLIKPSLAQRILPKSGQWMDSLKTLMIISLLLLNSWLFFILYTQHNIEFISKIIIVHLLIILFTATKNNKLAKSFISFIIVIISLNLVKIQYQNFSQNIDSTWIKFDEKLLDQYLKQDKTIFVDITASWCITCQYNHFTIFNISYMKNFFHNNNIILMRGDLSKPDPKLVEFINRYKRAGIPFNAFFNKNLAQPIVFNEILTKDKVVQTYRQINHHYNQ